MCIINDSLIIHELKKQIRIEYNILTFLEKVNDSLFSELKVFKGMPD